MDLRISYHTTCWQKASWKKKRFPILATLTDKAGQIA